MNTSHPIPVIHEFAAFLNIPDLALYHAIVHYFSHEVKDKYNHFITLDNKDFKFWSKPGGLIGDNGKNMFEYILQYRSEDKASKCTITIKGFKQGLRTVSGKTFDAPFKGTQFHVQCSYFSKSDILKVYWDFLKVIDAERFAMSIDNEKSIIYQCARHIRYHESREKEVVQLLRAIKQESSTRGDYELVEKYKYGSFEMYKLSVPNFDCCNITTDYIHDVKTYRILNFHKRLSTDPLRHPKLEVFLNNPEQAKHHSVKWSEYDKLVLDQDRLLSKLIHLLDTYMDYVGDSYFDPSRKYTPRWSMPTWDYKTLKESPEIDLPDDNKLLRFLSIVAFTPSGSISMNEIIRITKIPQSTAYRYLATFRNAKILDHCNGLVFFVKSSVWSSIQKSLAGLSNYLNFGFSYLYGCVCKTSDIIRSYAEQHKNHEPVIQLDTSPIIVDNEHDFQRIKKELAKHGIKRQVFISRLNYQQYYKKAKTQNNPFVSSGRTFCGKL